MKSPALAAMTAAFRTEALDLEPVFHDGISKTPRQVSFDIVDAIVGKFLDPFALQTPEMTVVVTSEDSFVVHVAVLEIDLVDEPGVSKEGQQAVNRGLRDPHPSLPQGGVKGFHVEMIGRFEDLFDDVLAFPGIPQPLFPEIVPEDLFFGFFLHGSPCVEIHAAPSAVIYSQ